MLPACPRARALSLGQQSGCSPPLGGLIDWFPHGTLDSWLLRSCKDISVGMSRSGHRGVGVSVGQVGLSETRPWA